MSLIQVNGLRLNVEVQGNGPPVVLLHGFTGNIHTWDLLVPFLKDQYTVVLVDLIGHGQSDAPDNANRYTMEWCVDDMASLVEKLKLEDPVWVGYSMGGRVCLSLGVFVPDKCKALILEGASGGIIDNQERSERKARDQAVADSVLENGIEDFINFWESQPLFASQKSLGEDIRKKIRQQRLDNRKIGLSNSLIGMGGGSQPLLYNELGNLKKPVMFLAGAKDLKYKDLARYMSSIAPKGFLSIISNAGHCVHLEEPDPFKFIVLDFLGKLTGSINEGCKMRLDFGGR